MCRKMLTWCSENEKWYIICSLQIYSEMKYTHSIIVIFGQIFCITRHLIGINREYIGIMLFVALNDFRC